MTAEKGKTSPTPCMPMGAIRVRLPDDLHEELDLAGVRVSEVVREELTRLAHRLRAKRKMEALAKHRKPAPRPVADILRDVRDEH